MSARLLSCLAPLNGHKEYLALIYSANIIFSHPLASEGRQRKEITIHKGAEINGSMAARGSDKFLMLNEKLVSPLISLFGSQQHDMNP